MKKPLLYIGSVFIFILAAVAFVFVPAKMGEASTSNSEVFGKYDGKPIELKPGTEFANAVRNIKDNYERNGVNIDDSQYFYIYSYAFNSAIQAIQAKTAVEKSGYEPSDREVSRQMLKYFLNEDGKFDPKIAALYSDEQKEEIRKSIKDQLTKARFTEDLFGSADEIGGNKLFGLKSTEKENAFIAKIDEDRRSFDILSFNKSNYPDGEILKFANENKSLFEKFDLSAISFSDEATAKKVQNQIAKGEISFADAVKEEYSEKYFTDNNGKITAAYQYQVKGILADESNLDTIKSLSKDSVSDVIKTSSGFTLFKKDGEISQADFNDTNTFDVVKKYVNSNESTRIEDYFINIAKNFTASAVVDGFENLDIESVEGAEKLSVSDIALNYGGVSSASKLPTDVKQLAAAVNNENFWEKAFSLKNGAYSEPIVLGNYVVVLKLSAENKNNADQTKLDSVKTEIENFDQTSAYSAMLNSDKVENNIWNAYAKLHLSNK